MKNDGSFDLEASEDMTDHQIFRLIEARGDISDLSTDEGWAILADRYPDDARFLLLNIYEEVLEGRYRKSYPLEMLFRKLKRLLKLRAQLPVEMFNTLLSVVGAIVQDEMEEEAQGGFEDIVMSTMDLPAVLKRGSEGYKKAVATLATYSREIASDGTRRSSGTGSLTTMEGSSDRELSYDDWCSKTRGQAEVLYSTRQAMKPGDRIAHPKFGTGFVIASSQGRAEILFQDGKRRLVCG